MDKKQEQFAIGYVRVPDVNDDDELHKKFDKIKAHCEENGLRLALIFSENQKGSGNFKGPGWADLEQTLHYAEGRIQSIVVPDKNMLTNDAGLYLLKEKELRDNFGVTIEVAEGKSQKLDQSKGMYLN